MKKNLKKILAILLVVIATFSTASVGIIASAANVSGSIGYNQPENSGDYAYWNGSKVVKSSSTSKDEIKWMQAALNYCITQRGLNASKLTIDGSFGPASKSATTAFQRATGLSADGSFGPATIQKMKYVLDNNIKFNSSNGKMKLVWPVKGFTTGNITGKYGCDGGSTQYRDNNRIHSGLDMANGKTGNAVLATAAGEVIFVGYTNARGNYVVIYHKDLGISSLYEHMKSNSITVKVGSKVSAGQQIGKLGNTGVGTGAHLHFGLMNGKATSVNYDLWKVGGSTNSFSPDPRYNSNISYTFK